MPRERLLTDAWGFSSTVETNAVDVYVGYLRRKLEEGGEPRLIHTVRGVGYVLRRDRSGESRMRLQTRIALSAAAAVLAAVALFGAGAYYLISERAYDRLDGSLSDTADRVAAELAGPGRRAAATSPSRPRRATPRRAHAQRRRRPRRHPGPAGSPRPARRRAGRAP